MQIITSRVTAHSKPSKSSLRLWDRPDISDAFGDIGPEGTALALGKDEFMALAQHKWVVKRGDIGGKGEYQQQQRQDWYVGVWRSKAT
jgi:hypothetical protein